MRLIFFYFLYYYYFFLTIFLPCHKPAFELVRHLSQRFFFLLIFFNAYYFSLKFSIYIFEVVPSSATIEPGGSVAFEVRGSSPTPCKVAEKLIVTTTIDKKTKTTNSAEVCVEFANPLLRFSSPLLSFFWAYSPNEGAQQLVLIPSLLLLKEDSPLKIMKNVQTFFLLFFLFLISPSIS